MADRQAYSTSNPPTTGYGEARTIKALGGATALVTGDLALNKTVALFRVPAGFTVTGLKVLATDMDTGGSPALVLAIGDSGDDDRLLTASNIGQAGTSNLSALVAATGLLYQYTAETEIVLKATTAAATAAAGTITVALEGYMA
jgi:hypothetical protein